MFPLDDAHNIDIPLRRRTEDGCSAWTTHMKHMFLLDDAQETNVPIR